MATVIVNHRVKDFATWKPLYDSDAPMRTQAGFKELAVGERQDDPGMVYLIWEVADTNVVEGMMADPALQARMQEAGVISAPEVVILN
ncbi:MAG: DUF3764 family protein [Bacteroidota bacterium]